jgi:hypothetical protein
MPTARIRKLPWLPSTLLTALLAAAPGSAQQASEAPDFDRLVRPVLSDACFQCHGPDAGTRAAGLRLDQPEAVQTALPKLVERLRSSDPAERMPPPEAHRQLSAEERGRLLAWLEAGAPWAEHWAFVPPERAAPPSLPADFSPGGEPTASGWGRNAIDAFIGARLAAAGQRPAPAAEPSALLRRVFLLLTGLPPTPDEQDAFALESAERGVDAALDGWIVRLCSEEPYLSRYAEQRARSWLDQARYADTAGIHMDAGWQAWAWRDWVLEAYRQNLPFDRFGTLQLAGDLLPEAGQDEQVASGFHRLHVTTDEGGAIDEEYLVEYAVDRVATTGSVFLGLTLGCARCHDHKYDPISMEEFYGLFACFNSVEQPGLYTQEPDPTRAFEPFVVIERPEDRERLAALFAERQRLEAERLAEDPEEQQQWERFRSELEGALEWPVALAASGSSEGGAELFPEPDGSFRVAGARPAQDVLRLSQDYTGGAFDTLLLEALPEDGPGGSGKIGRADNGNAVLRHLAVKAISSADPSRAEPVELAWVGASHEQHNGDFAALNVLDERDSWWALDGHQRPGARWLLVRFARPAGFPEGTRFEVTLDHHSPWAAHAFARPRLSFGWGGAALDGRLPIARGRFQRASGFRFRGNDEAYDTVYAPERQTRLETGVEYPRVPEDEGQGRWSWSFDERLTEGPGHELETAGREVLYLARELIVPSARRVRFELGSDDGLELLLDGQTLYERRIERGLSQSDDAAEVELPAGRHLLLHKVVNTGGQAGFFQRLIELPGVDPLELLALALPAPARPADGARPRELWREARSPRYREVGERLAALAAEEASARAGQPKAMVMRERAMPRETFVLARGDYRHPDRSRPVARSVPAVLGRWPDEAPRDRLGLARWLFSPQNPLTARVFVNRLWAEVFGRGLVATGDDFGLQGERPSHPELLDWLAVEFVESGYDQRALLGLMLGSATFRQSSRSRPELAPLDPDDRLLGRYPRRRLTAAEIRDGALFAAGLLVERLGGPSAKPYQPPGLWEEVAMPQSNTRRYDQGSGESLWRRSLYTYWKRAAPPPAMLSFDAPTREFCVTERSRTETPLQALVLQNDVQFLEAARALAQRTLIELDAGYAPAPEMPAELVRRGLELLFRRVLARAPLPEESAALSRALADFRDRFRAAPHKAEALLAAGEAPRDPRLDQAELAAWTFLASSTLNLFEATNPR